MMVVKNQAEVEPQVSQNPVECHALEEGECTDLGQKLPTLVQEVQLHQVCRINLLVLVLLCAGAGVGCWYCMLLFMLRVNVYVRFFSPEWLSQDLDQH